jgi:hypothetical protein
MIKAKSQKSKALKLSYYSMFEFALKLNKLPDQRRSVIFNYCGVMRAELPADVICFLNYVNAVAKQSNYFRHILTVKAGNVFVN